MRRKMNDNSSINTSIHDDSSNNNVVTNPLHKGTTVTISITIIITITITITFTVP